MWDGNRGGTGHLTERTIRRLFRVVLPAMAAAACILSSHHVLPAEILGGGDPHAHFRNPVYCSRCHVLVGGKPVPGRFAAEADLFCLECHQNEDLGRSHPRNVRPRDSTPGGKVPEEFRLDDRGRIVCVTCHKGHGTFLSTVRAYPRQEPERSSSRNSPKFRTYYLRRSDPVHGFVPLCRGCHPRL